MRTLHIRKAVPVLLLFALLLGVMPVPVFAEDAGTRVEATVTEGNETADSFPFDDVKAGSYYYDPVVWAYREGITAGTSETNFTPNRALTYAEICTFMWRFAYSPSPRCGYAQLKTYSKRYYYDSVNWCCDFGVIAIDEVSNGNTPNAIMTRNDFVYTLYRYAQNWERRSIVVNGNRLSDYVDAPTDSAHRAAWNWAVDRGVVTGTSSTTLSPQDSITRAQFVTMLYRYNEYRINNVPAAELASETLTGVHLRGWQRTLIEAGELCLGRVAWVDHAYELGSDRIPVRIDCSGFIEWAYTYTRLRPCADQESIDLWNNLDTFTRVYRRGQNETGYAFVKRVRAKLQTGDILFCHTASGYHSMVFLGSTSDSICVIHCRNRKGVIVERFPITDNSYYVVSIFGVKRHIP